MEMSDINDLINLLEKNNEILNEMEKDCASLPSSDDSWFYLIPNDNEDQNSSPKKKETIPVDVYVDIIEKPESPKLVNESVSNAENSDSQSLTSDNKIFFTSSQRYFSDLFVTDPESVDNLCKSMRIRDLKTEELLELCSSFENNSNISLQTASLIHIFKEALFYKIQNLTMESKMPDILRSGVKTLTVKHPSLILESVLKPCLDEKKIDVCQIEVLCLILDVLHENYLPSVLDYMSSTDLVGDGAISCLEVIVNRGINFDEANLTKLLNYMKLINEACDNNIKFGKLLLHVLNFFKEQVTKSHLDLLTSIVNNHKSFMKKPIMSKLNK